MYRFFHRSNGDFVGFHRPPYNVRLGEKEGYQRHYMHPSVHPKPKPWIHYRDDNINKPHYHWNVTSFFFHDTNISDWKTPALFGDMLSGHFGYTRNPSDAKGPMILGHWVKDIPPGHKPFEYHLDGVLTTRPHKPNPLRGLSSLWTPPEESEGITEEKFYSNEVYDLLSLPDDNHLQAMLANQLNDTVRFHATNFTIDNHPENNDCVVITIKEIQLDNTPSDANPVVLDLPVGQVYTGCKRLAKPESSSSDLPQCSIEIVTRKKQVPSPKLHLDTNWSICKITDLLDPYAFELYYGPSPPVSEHTWKWRKNDQEYPICSNTTVQIEFFDEHPEHIPFLEKWKPNPNALAHTWDPEIDKYPTADPVAEYLMGNPTTAKNSISSIDWLPVTINDVSSKTIVSSINLDQHPREFASTTAITSYSRHPKFWKGYLEGQLSRGNPFYAQHSSTALYTYPKYPQPTPSFLEVAYPEFQESPTIGQQLPSSTLTVYQDYDSSSKTTLYPEAQKPPVSPIDDYEIDTGTTTIYYYNYPSTTEFVKPPLAFSEVAYPEYQKDPLNLARHWYQNSSLPFAKFRVPGYTKVVETEGISRPMPVTSDINSQAVRTMCMMTSPLAISNTPIHSSPSAPSEVASNIDSQASITESLMKAPSATFSLSTKDSFELPAAPISVIKLIASHALPKPLPESRETSQQSMKPVGSMIPTPTTNDLFIDTMYPAGEGPGYSA